MWPLSIGYAAALLEREGRRVSLLDTWARRVDPDGIVRFALEQGCDLFIIDTTSATIDMTIDLARRLKGTGSAPSVWVMGQHASILPETVLAPDGPVDGCLLGEVEETVTELASTPTSRGGGAGVRGIAYRDESSGRIVRTESRPLIEDLDGLPRFRPSLFEAEGYRIWSSQVPTFHRLRWGFLLTSRGCPYSCIYCSATLRQSYGTAYRAQSAGRVADDVIKLSRDHGVNAIYMEDDIFSLDRGRTLEICDALAREGSPVWWVIQTRPDALDSERIERLRQAGCVGITLGIESGSDRVLQTLQKGITLERIRSTLREIRAAGIGLTAYFMIGNPGETLEDLEATFRLARESGALLIQVAFFTAYPGSPMHGTLDLGEEEFSGYSHYNALRENFSDVQTEALVSFQKRFYLRYYLSIRTLWRYLRRRGLYAFWNNKEATLIWRSLRFFAARRRRGRTRGSEPGAAE